MKLKLKHIQNYPIGGYNALNITDGCEVKLVDGIYTFDNKKEFWYKSCGWNLHRDSWKPLLLPMSSLYTEMEDGTVPIVELAKITGWLTIQDWEVSHKVVDGCFTCGVRWFDEEDEKYYVFGWDEVNGFGMHERPSRDIHFVPNQLKLFTYLFENHFDVFSLIDKGLALDKTKIK